MKNTLLIASAALAAGGAAVVYWIKRNRSANLAKSAEPVVKKMHHRTDVFSKAKAHNL